MSFRNRAVFANSALCLLLLALPACRGETDADADGYPATEDCDDDDASVYPGATESCNGVDDDCDGAIDESGAEGTSTWYMDSDGDGYGQESNTAQACSAPSGMVAEAGDCDDGDSSIHPGARESCDGVDDDCDGLVDDEDDDLEGGSEYYLDSDGDGYGQDEEANTACEAPEGYAEEPGDCDDEDEDVRPGAAEVCDGVDNDCDDLVDDEDSHVSGQVTVWPDADGDGYGTEEGEVEVCDVPSGYGTETGDCDDSDASVYPGAAEVCGDGLVNDCGNDEEDPTLACLEEWGSEAATAVLLGTPSETDWGEEVAFAGDVNGDGEQDLVMTSDGPGAMALVYGPVSGELSLEAADALISGDGLEESSLSAGGDFNGDGYDDLLVGLPLTENEAGAAAIYLGPVNGSTAAAEYDLAIDGMPKNRAGWQVAALGDADQDGYEDFAMSIEGSKATGQVGVVYGPVTATAGFATLPGVIEGAAEEDGLGGGLASAGDVDGDGFGDLLVGADNDSRDTVGGGVAYLALGPLTATRDPDDLQALFVAENEGDELGSALAGAGDVDGDGLDDLLLGAYYADDPDSNCGALYVVTSVPSGTFSMDDSHARLQGEGSGERLGVSASTAGDLDEDGYDDLLLGAPYTTDQGVAWLVHGPVTGEAAIGDVGWQIGSTDDWAWFGTAVAGGTDVDGDEVPDYLVSAPDYDATDEARGAVYLFSGIY